ncbi:hypothetical protein HDU84_003915, partial [Entophlyctis sp. JEL0112]
AFNDLVSAVSATDIEYPERHLRYLTVGSASSYLKASGLPKSYLPEIVDSSPVFSFGL